MRGKLSSVNDGEYGTQQKGLKQKLIKETTGEKYNKTKGPIRKDKNERPYLLSLGMRAKGGPVGGKN